MPLTKAFERFSQMPDFLEKPYIAQCLDSKTIRLYCLLYNRWLLSLKNNWKNVDGAIYFLYPNKELAKKMNLSERTINRCKALLTKYNLISKVSKDSLIIKYKLNIACWTINKPSCKRVFELRKTHIEQKVYGEKEKFLNSKISNAKSLRIFITKSRKISELGSIDDDLYEEIIPETSSNENTKSEKNIENSIETKKLPLYISRYSKNIDFIKKDFKKTKLLLDDYGIDSKNLTSFELRRYDYYLSDPIKKPFFLEALNKTCLKNGVRNKLLYAEKIFDNLIKDTSAMLKRDETMERKSAEFSAS